MKNRSLKPRHQKLYLQIFMSMILSIVITIFVLSSILYLNFEKIALAQINTYTTDNLTKVSFSVNMMMDNAKLVTVQIYNDRDIRNILYGKDLDEADMNISRLRLSSYRNTAPFIQSIYVYNRLEDSIYADQTNPFRHSRSSFFDKTAMEMIDDESKKQHLLPCPRIIKGDTTLSFDVFHNVYSFIFYESPRVHARGDNAIILNISEDWMSNMINSLNMKHTGSTFIINGKGQRVISDKETPMLADVSGEEHIKRILRDTRKSGYFLHDIDGVRSLVTFVSSKSADLDWRFVSIIPYSSVTRQIDTMKRNTVLFGGLILLAGMLLAYVASRSLFKPINSILENLKKLESEKKGAQSSLKQEFLRSLVKVGSHYKMDTIRSRFSDFAIQLDPSGSFCLILFKIDHYKDFCTRFNYSDRSLFRFAIMNITGELASLSFHNECIDMETDHVLLLLNVPESRDRFNEILNDLISNIQSSVKKYLEISLSTVVSHPQDSSLETVGRSYSQAVEASSNRMFLGHGCIVHADELQRAKSSDYTYSPQKEKALVNAIMLKKLEETDNLIKELLMGTEKYSYAALNLTVLRLTLAISSAVENIERNSGIEIKYNFDEFVTQLGSLETIAEINQHFHSMLEYVISRMEVRKSTNHDELVEKITEAVQARYMDKNLSVDTFATEFHMSPVYLGRLFKRISGKSIAEYITEIRIDKAKELLTTTSNPINDITDQSGFSNSNYFYTIFRKLNGITPAEYRQKAHERD